MPLTILRGLRTAAAAGLLVAAIWSQAPGLLARSAEAAEKGAPVLCGTLDAQIGAGFATGPVDAEGCFYQAFLTCAPALLTVQINPTGPGGLHTLMTGIGDSGCIVADRTEPTVDSVPTDGSSQVVCAGLTLTEAGLMEQMCSGGPPLAPIPLSAPQPPAPD